MLNRGVFGVKLRSFWCGTEEFWGLKSSGPLMLNCCVELRGWGTEGAPISIIEAKTCLVKFMSAILA